MTYPSTIHRELTAHTTGRSMNIFGYAIITKFNGKVTLRLRVGQLPPQTMGNVR